MSKKPGLRLVDNDFAEAGVHKGRRRMKTARNASRDARVQAGTNQTRPATGAGGSKPILARTEGQQRLLDVIASSDITLAIGPAGCGKTLLAIHKAVEALDSGRVKRIVISRPAVEAGEKLGFLPGDMKEKVDPYMRPIYDALMKVMSAQRMAALVQERIIEIAPIGFLRGRTLSECAIVIDEAQNCTHGQLKMVVTRLGEDSFMVLTGDPDQSDLYVGDSGFADLADRIEGKDTAIGVVRLSGEDVVRHRTVRKLVELLAA